MTKCKFINPFQVRLQFSNTYDMSPLAVALKQFFNPLTVPTLNAAATLRVAPKFSQPPVFRLSRRPSFQLGKAPAFTLVVRLEAEHCDAQLPPVQLVKALRT